MLIFASVKRLSVTVSVSNDLLTDQRVSKVCNSLYLLGYEVKLLGRLLPNSLEFERPYETRRFRLMFNKGPLFYFNLNLVLFFYLVFSRKTILLSNDLDTLPANFFASKLRRFQLVYDSHELFSEVPELVNRPKVQKIWRSMESYFLPKLENCYTVSQHIAQHYMKLYGVDFKIIRNFPILQKAAVQVKENYILYQGALNVGRGVEDVIKAMNFVDDFQLLIAGTGDIEEDLKQLTNDLGLSEKVIFLGRLLPDELKVVTAKAKLGFSLEEDLGLNYRYAVPNKIFDYIHAGVPILYSPLVEVMTLLKKYSVGEVLISREAESLASQIMSMLNSKLYDDWVKNCLKARKEFNWENEEKKLKEIFSSID